MSEATDETTLPLYPQLYRNRLMVRKAWTQPNHLIMERLLDADGDYYL